MVLNFSKTLYAGLLDTSYTVQQQLLPQSLQSRLPLLSLEYVLCIIS